MAKYLFHSTRFDRLENIRAEGLTPNTDRDPTFDGYPVDGRLYASESAEGAKFYARRIEDAFDYKSATLRFKTKAEISVDNFGNIGDVYFAEPIAPRRIEVLQKDQWIPLSSLAFGPAAVPRPQPNLVVGALTLFARPDEYVVTNNGKEMHGDLRNLVVRLAVDAIDDTKLVAIATPGVPGHAEDIVELLNRLKLTPQPKPYNPEANLARHGIEFRDGEWVSTALENVPNAP